MPELNLQLQNKFLKIPKTISMGMAYSAILGFFLMGCAYLAIGMFLSAVSENQIIAAVLSVPELNLQLQNKFLKIPKRKQEKSTPP